ncbi:hypothetical protein [Halomonas elongata]|uniref:hypothetical protein n=1 Tax=Halomonas elongata TaxID=2746 RepID=UPI00186B6E36|nr:hypothetical protein [Halomonas elongata]MBW5801201.1 hypothetical protein [Halomonas elongata]
MPLPNNPDWEAMKYKVGDTTEAVLKQNRQVEAFKNFGDGMAAYVDEAVDGIFIAGGKMFSSIQEGRDAVGDGQYYFVANPSQYISRAVYRRISSTESRLITVEPTQEYTTQAVSRSISAMRVWSYPNTDFHLQHPQHLLADQSLNIIRSDGADGFSVSLRRGEMRETPYPYTAFRDKAISARVGRDGGVLSAQTPRSLYGRPAAYPYTAYADKATYAIVDGGDNVVALPAAASQPAPFSESGPMHVSLDKASGELYVSWQHGTDQMMRVCYRPNGHNDLFNWRSTEVADLGDPEKAAWLTISSSLSDSWPPFRVKAVNNGDGGGRIYTGGNHGGGGGASGEQTARMTSLSFTIDGRRVEPGALMRGYAREVIAHWVNEVMAYNTITLERYVLQQEIRATFRPGDISGFSRITALEDIEIETDNGPQTFSTGYDTLHFYEGQDQTRQLVSDMSGASSGYFQDYPTWAAVLGSSQYGFHGTWMDREFGAGDGRYLSGSIGYWRRGDGSNTKVYAAVIGDTEVQALASGDYYEWHGGYFWSPPNIASNLDSAFTFHRRGVPNVGYCRLTAGDGAIQMPSLYDGREVESVGVSGLSGVPVSTTGYVTAYSKII